MAVTLADAQALSQDKLTDAVIDEFRKSPLLDALQFDNTVKPQGGRSLSYVYNRVTTQPTAAGRVINAEYTSQEAKTTQYTTNLIPLGGSYQIDRVIAKDETQVVNEVEFQSTQKAKAAIALFNDLFINGDAGTAGQFDGIDQAIAAGTTVDAASLLLDNAADVKTNYGDFLYALRQLVSKMDGEPTHLLMNGSLFAAFQSIADYVPNITFERNALGQQIVRYGNAVLVPMGDKAGTSNPIIATSTPSTSVTGNTTLYAVRLGLDGVHGVSPDGSKVVENYLPDFTTPGAVKTGEVEMVTAAVVKASKAVGKITNLALLPKTA